MKRHIGRAAQAILLVGIFCLTLLFTLPLGALSGLIAANLPEGVGLEEPRGRLLDGRATALIVEPRPGWPLRFEPLNWHLGLDGWRPELHLGIGDGWALDARLEGLNVAWQLEGGDLAALDTSALPLGVASASTAGWKDNWRAGWDRAVAWQPRGSSPVHPCN
ncbi:hypothetical protein A8U91_02885 [Halomonas elongata]|uniref:Uncharacterized protein n=1 Tax=Halomonas elongata TaxID=2746 RepID=A0A1B8NV62_HALEL|nr:hypothetical protein [Halomonas elongata]OBX33843.1 hypothetical protein A8U91_02885 [Halomonas elongata]